MRADVVVAGARFALLTLTGMMLVSRALFQWAGPVRMRAFLDAWRTSATKRLWGGASVGWGAGLLAGTLAVFRRLPAPDRAVTGLAAAILLGDGLLNTLPGAFGRFKDALQQTWVRREGAGARAGDAALFGTVNAWLAGTSLATAGAVITYRPATKRLVIGAAALALAMAAALIMGTLLEGRLRRRRS